MLKVLFYENIEDHLLKFAVITSKSNGKWVLCKHKERDTYECPGGHREKGEAIIDTANRELYEETGAVDYSLFPICVYSVERTNDRNQREESYGMLYYADIKSFDQLPDMEMEKVELFDDLPSQWTYPLIQPKLIEKVNSMIKINEI